MYVHMSCAAEHIGWQTDVTFPSESGLVIFCTHDKYFINLSVRQLGNLYTISFLPMNRRQQVTLVSFLIILEALVICFFYVHCISVR